MNQATMARRSWQFPRPVIGDYLRFTLVSWVVAVVTVVGMTLVLAYFDILPASVWDWIGGPARFYLAATSWYLIYTLLPVYVANGRTRRGFAIEALIVLLVLAAVFAVLLTVGYLLESQFYQVAGWSQGPPEDHLFTSYRDLPLIAAEYALVFPVWAAVGAFVGAAFYWHGGWGAFSLIPAFVLVALISVATGQSLGPLSRFFEQIATSDAATVGLAAVVSIACTLVAGGLTWWVLRDVPIRNR